MMESHVRRLRDHLARAMDAAGIAGARDVHYEVQGRFFTVAGTGVEVALSERAGRQFWCVREVYDIPDLEDGGHRTVVETLEELELEDDIAAAKRAALHAVERKIDLALEETA